VEMLNWESGFLEKKFKSNLIFTLPFVLLFGIIALVFHPEMKYITLYIFCCFIIVLWLSINFKYAKYNPFFPELPTSHIMGMMTLLIVFPGGILITLGYGIWQYFGARRNLRGLFS